jgi:GTP-binding protein
MFETIVRHVPAPDADPDGPFKMLATLLDRDNFVGRVLTGRIASGKLRVNMPIKSIDADGKLVEEGRATKLFAFRGIERVPSRKRARATSSPSPASPRRPCRTRSSSRRHRALARPEDRSADAGDDLHRQRFADGGPRGHQGHQPHDPRPPGARGGRQCLLQDHRSADKDSFEVAGRGELQLGVLIETMRREGFELTISRPRVLFRDGRDGREEPYEQVVIDVDDEYSGTVVEKMAQRKAELTDMRPSGGGKTRITFSGPSRGLIGYHGEFLSDTRGTGIMNRTFERYGPVQGPHRGAPERRPHLERLGRDGDLRSGPLEDRGILMVGPQEPVYEGMIIGENAKPEDLEVNPMKTKQLTNFRASGGKDDAIRLTPPKRMTLEQAIAYIQDDELVEVTPKSIRLRKRHLDPHERKKASRKASA